MDQTKTFRKSPDDQLASLLSKIFTNGSASEFELKQPASKICLIEKKVFEIFNKERIAETFEAFVLDWSNLVINCKSTNQLKTRVTFSNSI